MLRIDFTIILKVDSGFLYINYEASEMKTEFTFLVLFFSVSLQAQTTDSIPIAGSYYESKNLDIGFYGFQGYSFDLTLSQKKVCKTCYRIHSKMFGGGLEIGQTLSQKIVGGPKLYYHRGQNFGAIRISLGLLTNFDEWIAVLRPEIMAHFFKDKSLSLGLAFNFSYNLELEGYEFGFLSLGARYYLEIDKKPSG